MNLIIPNSYESWNWKENLKQKILFLHSLNQSELQNKWFHQFLDKSLSYILERIFFLQRKEPKILWAMENLDFFPVDLKNDPTEKLVNVPGISLSCAMKIKEFQNIKFTSLKKLGCNYYLAQHFIAIDSYLPKIQIRKKQNSFVQYTLFE